MRKAERAAMPDDPARILVVDDEPALREMLVDALDGGDLRVSAVGSGKEALDLAGRTQVDFVITDLCLGDCTGLDVLDEFRSKVGDVPAVVITGHGDARSLAEASRRRPVEVMLKPLDIDRLRSTIRQELSRRKNEERRRLRDRRLRRLVRYIHHQRKHAAEKLESTCADLTTAYRTLSGRMAIQEQVLDYQHDLLSATNDDDVFRVLFRLFVHHSGPTFGVALVCNTDAELRVIGRFGVPQPDSIRFCEILGAPIINAVLADPQCLLMDATDRLEMFDESIRRYMVGVNVLAVPLVPAEGEMIGMAVLYRKGEQPFCEDDVELAEMISAPTGVAIQRNE